MINSQHADMVLPKPGQAKIHKKRFTIPHGLKTLLEEMSREILRFNPDDIPLHLADYLEGRLAQRKADYLLTGKEDGEGYFDNFGNREFSKDQPTGQASGFLQQLEGAKDGQQIPYSSDDKLVAIAESGQLYADGLGQGQVVGINPFTGLPVDQQDGQAIIDGNGTGGQFQKRSLVEYGGRKGASGPYGAYDLLAEKEVDVNLGSIPEQIDNIVQEVAAAVDLTRDIKPGVPGPEFEQNRAFDSSRGPGSKMASGVGSRQPVQSMSTNPGAPPGGPGSKMASGVGSRQPVQTMSTNAPGGPGSKMVSGVGSNAGGPPGGPGSNIPPWVGSQQQVQEMTMSSVGSASGVPPRGPGSNMASGVGSQQPIQKMSSNAGGPRATVQESVEVLNRAIELVDVLQDLETAASLSGQPVATAGPNASGIGPAGSRNVVSSAAPTSRLTSGANMSGGGANQAGMNSSQAPMFPIPNLASSNMFPLNLTESSSFTHMIRQAIENMLQKLIIALAGTGATTAQATNEAVEQFQQQQRELLRYFDASTGIQGLESLNPLNPNAVASVRLNPVNFAQSGATASTVGNYPNLPPGSGVALAGSSVQHVYDRGVAGGISGGVADGVASGVGSAGVGSGFGPTGVASASGAGGVASKFGPTGVASASGAGSVASKSGPAGAASGFGPSGVASAGGAGGVASKFGPSGVASAGGAGGIASGFGPGGVGSAGGVGGGAPGGGPGSTIPLKGLGAWMRENNVQQIDHMNLGQYVEGMVQRATQLVDLSKQSYEENPSARQNVYYITDSKDTTGGMELSKRATAVDLLNTTTQLLATIETTDVEDENVHALMAVTQQMLEALQAHIARGEQEGENPLALEALRMGAESLEVAMILLKDSMNPRDAKKGSGASNKSGTSDKSKGGMDVQNSQLAQSGAQIIASATGSKRNFGIDVTDGDGTSLKLSRSGKHFLAPDGTPIPLKQTPSGQFVTPNGLIVKFDQNGKIVGVDDTATLKVSPSGKHLIAADGKVVPLLKTASGHSVTASGLRVDFDPTGKISSVVPVNASNFGIDVTDGDGTSLKLSRSGKHFLTPDGTPIPLKQSPSGQFVTPNGLIVKFDENGKICGVDDTATLKVSPSGKHLIAADGKVVPLLKTASGHSVTASGLRVDFDPTGKISSVLPVNAQKSQSSPSSLNKSVSGSTGSGPAASNSKSSPNVAARPEPSMTAAAASSVQAAPLVAGFQDPAAQLAPNGSGIGNPPQEYAWDLGLEGADGDLNNLLFPESRMEFSPGMGEWVGAVRDFMSNQIDIIRRLLTGQLGMAEARGQVIFLSIAFIVGIVVGFAVARSLTGSSSAPPARMASFFPIPFLSQEDVTRFMTDLGILSEEQI